MISTPINIDLSDLITEFSMTELQATQLGSGLIDALLLEYQSKWDDLVGKELKQSRAEYKRAMVVERNSPFEVTFGLLERESVVALMVEEGASPFDEKRGFSISDKKKEKKDGGWYLTIPFRHATPGAVAESGAFSGILPQDIYKIVKDARSPLSFMDLPPQHQAVGNRAAINMPGLVVPEYVHQSPIYQGLTKVNIASTDKENRNGYFTFRRVSDTSEPNSWWNGGITARKLMDRALEESRIEQVADQIIDMYLQNL